jgi:hypothetical protein
MEELEAGPSEEMKELGSRFTYSQRAHGRIKLDAATEALSAYIFNFLCVLCAFVVN